MERDGGTYGHYTSGKKSFELSIADRLRACGIRGSDLTAQRS